MINIRKLEAELWEAADLLRVDSEVTSQQYCMPVLGLIFLRYVEMWSMLCVPKDCESIDEVLGSFDNSNTNEFYAFSYTWNKSVEYFSEFGDVAIRSFGGGIKRIC